MILFSDNSINKAAGTLKNLKFEITYICKSKNTVNTTNIKILCRRIQEWGYGGLVPSWISEIYSFQGFFWAQMGAEPPFKQINPPPLLWKIPEYALCSFFLALGSFQD